MNPATATHSDAMRVFSSVFVIAQRYTRDKEYLISWLQKQAWNSYFLSDVLFPSF